MPASSTASYIYTKLEYTKSGPQVAGNAYPRTTMMGHLARCPVLESPPGRWVGLDKGHGARRRKSQVVVLAFVHRRRCESKFDVRYFSDSITRFGNLTATSYYIFKARMLHGYAVHILEPRY